MKTTIKRKLSLIVLLALGFVVLLVVWAITGGLWERQEPTINFRQLYQDQVATERATTQQGEAERIRNDLYQGTGLSIAPSVEPSERQRQERARREAEKPLRLQMQRAAIENLRKKLGESFGDVAVEDIVLASWSERQWLDSALGCANPGEVMVPENLPGWMFILSFAGDPTSFYIYNATRDGRKLRFCRREKQTTET